jgi:uncharacterized repeat protein (TIGR01451 family)
VTGLVGFAPVPAATAATTAPATVVRTAAGTPEAPAQVWVEGFDSSGTALVRLGDYASGAYTADTYWLGYPNCNGVILTYGTSSFPGGECVDSNSTNQQNARINVRRLADVLGQVGAGVAGSTTVAGADASKSTAATRANRAVAEWTSSGTGSATANRVIARTTSLGITSSAARYYTASLDIVEASCQTTSNRSQLTLSLGYGTVTSTSGVITACTDPRASYYTSPLVSGQTGWIYGGDAVSAGRFTADSSLLVPANQLSNLRPVVRNLTTASAGNDFAVDNLRIVDSTPSLDLAFSSDTVTAGVPVTLTFTVTNTSELASKLDWSFSDALPSGLVVAPTPAVGGTCVQVGGAAFAVTAAAGSSTIAATGGDLAAGASSCTITVDVLSTTAGRYVNNPSDVTTMLVAPEPATLTVTPATTLTVRKNLPSRSSASDQFTLSLRDGSTTLAQATTSGTAPGIQSAQITRQVVRTGATYTIHEAATSGAGLSYSNAYECVSGSTVIASGAAASAAITIPAQEGAEITCTFTNSLQTVRLVCDTNRFYALSSTGVLRQADMIAGTSPTVGTWTGATRANALGVGAGGAVAYALDRSSDDTDVASILKWSASGGFQTLSGSDYITRDASGTEIAGSIVAGAVDLAGNRYLFGKFTGGVFYLWSYTESNPTASRYAYLGSFSAGSGPNGNGDMAFDLQGNLYVIGAATVNNVNSAAIFTVPASALSSASGGTLAVRTSTTKALTGTDASPAFGNVNGIAFSPRGTVYLSSSNGAYEFDPTTWTRIAGTAGIAMATTTDLAGCASPATLSVIKNVVGRAAAADQFQLTAANGSIVAATATTTGSTTGRQGAQIGPIPVVVGTAMTISEAMAAGSSSALASYTSAYECWADGTRIANGSGASGTVTMPSRMSVNVACTFFNSPRPASTVRITTQTLDGATGVAQPIADWTVAVTAAGTTGTATTLPNETADQRTDAAGQAVATVLYGGATSPVATVTVTERVPSGYVFVSATCTRGGTAISPPVAFSQTGDLVRGDISGVAPGADIACVMVNQAVATLTLVATVSSGTANPSGWTLSATRSSTSALPGPSGTTGVSRQVTPGVAYRLAETGGALTAVQVGAWQCRDAGGQTVAVSSASDVSLAPGAAVTCTVTNASASLTLLVQVDEPQAGFQPDTWKVTATPGAVSGGTLPTETRTGAAYVPGGNAASTFEVRPGHTYTLTEALVAQNSLLAYREMRLERLVGNAWVPTSPATIAAPGPGENTIYRFVNAPVPQTVLPLTGGPSTDAFTFGGLAVLVTALALAALYLVRRRRAATA